MSIEKFEDIISWQKAKELTLLTYSSFNESKDFRFRDQIQRSSLSIMNNIAEGFERKGNRDFKRFLYIAKGSTAELKSMLYIALEMKQINEEQFKKMYDLTIEISKLLSGFIKSISN